jgi:hypothetical protein
MSCWLVLFLAGSCCLHRAVVGKACKAQHNFNSLMAILSALNMTAVTRCVPAV